MTWEWGLAALALLLGYGWVPKAAFEVGVVVVDGHVQDGVLRNIGWTGQLRPWPFVSVVAVSTAERAWKLAPVHCSSEGVNFELEGVQIRARVTDAARYVRATNNAPLGDRLHNAMAKHLSLCSRISPSMIMLLDVSELAGNATAALDGALREAVGVGVSNVQIMKTFSSSSDIDEIHERRMAAGIRVQAAEAERRAIKAEGLNAELEVRNKVKADMIETNWTIDKMLRFAHANATAAYQTANASIAADLLAMQLLFPDRPHEFQGYLRANALKRSTATTYVIGA